MNKRPQRIRIRTELGKQQSLLGGQDQHQRMPGGPEVLVLGVGAEPADLANIVGAGKAVYVIEAPEFKGQMPPSWHNALPDHWQFIHPDNLDDELTARAEILIHRSAIRLFPSFWGPITGRVRLLKSAGTAPIAAKRSVLLPCAADGLLAREMGDALETAGLAVRRIDPQTVGTGLAALLQEERPSLFLSINFKGLDPYGEIFSLLDAAGVPVCVWCVDNPFHLLSGLRAPFWKQTHLAVTDSWFLKPLVDHGARSVLHLPLAASPEIFAGAKATEPELAEHMVFVGRSAFPGRSGFFSGSKVPDAAIHAARRLMDHGGRPDYSWWLDQLKTWRLWPGAGARSAGLGAENAGRERRFACVRAAARDLPLAIYGDEGWKDALPAQANLRPPVDYYSGLTGIYRSAAWTLNVTSLLLPAGLTQRHFDVWTAGGFLLSDDTPGLSIFPEKLTREICFSRPSEIPSLARRLAPGESLRDDLARAWREEVLTRHTYARRTAKLLEHLGI